MFLPYPEDPRQAPKVIAYGEWCWISKDLTLDQGPGLITQELLCSSFIKVRKGTEKASDTSIRRGVESAP